MSPVVMVTPKLPGRHGNLTGSYAHIIKICSALEALGVEVRMLELDFWPGETTGRVRYGAALATLVRDLRRELRLQPVAFHCHGVVAAAFVQVWARLMRIPVVCEVHGVHVPSEPGQPGARPVLSRLACRLGPFELRRVDHVIAQARAMKARLVRCGLAPERVTVLYPGLNIREFAREDVKPAEMRDVRPGEKVILYAGSSHPYQGLALLADAQRVLLEGRKDLKLVIVLSRDDGQREDVVSRYQFNPQWTLVVYPPRSSELPSWFKRADVLVHARPDCMDNINVQSKIGLYLASGKPVVATRVGDYVTLLSSSRGCILAQPEPASIASALAEAADCPAIAAAAREQNRTLAAEYFDVSKNARKLIEIYNRLPR